MIGTRKVFIYILSFPFIISLLSACHNHDTPIIQNNNWQVIYQNDALHLYSIKFLDKNHGFVMADSAAVHGLKDWKFVLSTEDGGITWNQITCTTTDTVPQFPLYELGYIHPISGNVLLATGYQVHKSIDRGNTWINVSPQLIGSIIEDLYVKDSITWIVAKGTEIYRTNNAGQIWESVFRTDFMGALQSFSFPTPDTGYITDSFFDIDNNQSAALLLKTIDGGQSWEVLKPEPWNSHQTNFPGIYSMQFVTDQIGFIVTENSGLWKTTNGGNSWSVINSTPSISSYMYFINDVKGYGSNGMTIYATKDGGKTWEIDNPNFTHDSDINNWTFLKSGLGIAVTRDHKIISTINLP